MINILYKSKNLFLSLAIQRYFKFVHSITLPILNNSYTSSRDTDVLLIDETEQDIQEIVRLLHDIKVLTIVVFGSKKNDRENYINLLNTSQIFGKFDSILDKDNPVKDHSALIEIIALKEKLRLFFQGHGETSLLASLYDVRYRLLNGIKLYLSKDIDFDESLREFLYPGINSWAGVKNRFTKNKEYLELLGFQQDIQKINSNILSFDQFIIKTEKFVLTGLLEYDEEHLNTSLGLLDKIDEILFDISTNLALTDAKV